MSSPAGRRWRAGVARLVIVPGALVSLAWGFRSRISRRGSRPHCRRRARRSRRWRNPTPPVHAI